MSSIHGLSKHHGSRAALQTPSLQLMRGALKLTALKRPVSLHMKQLKNIARTVNFFIFPTCLISIARCLRWKLQESGAEGVCQWAPCVMLGCSAALFALACRGGDPQRGFGGLSRLGGAP